MKILAVLLFVHHLSVSVCEIPYAGMTCDNGCSNSNSNDSDNFWCDKRRRGEGEDVWRCAELTRYGHLCVSDCYHRNGETYTSCRTGHHLSKAWEYCSKEGVTYNGKKCVDQCQSNGDYWWCNTADESWDYCSPPNEVTPASYTIDGQECVGRCDQRGKNYWWCYKSMRYKRCSGGAGEDDHWDYCSPDSKHTRYNEPCTNSCGHHGESYYWCRTANSWDYCSPKMDVNYTYSNDGGLCVGICDGKCPVLGYDGTCLGYSAYRWCDGISSGGRTQSSLLMIVSIMYLVK